MNPTPNRLVCWLILTGGVVATACSFIFIRESSEPPIMLAAWRVLLAALLLSPLYYGSYKRYGDESLSRIVSRSLLPGVVLSVHFITWVIGARISFGANATILVSLVPIALPIIVWLLFQETLNRYEWFATGLCVGGIALLAYDSMQLDYTRFIGDAICFVSMILFALYLALAKRFRHLPSIWLYLVPVYTIAGIVSLAVAPWFGPVAPSLTIDNLLMVAALASVSTVLGHSALNFSMQHLRAQTVGLMTLLQFVIAALLAYWLYQESPTVLFYPASFLMVTGIALVVIKQPS